MESFTSFLASLLSASLSAFDCFTVLQILFVIAALTRCAYIRCFSLSGVHFLGKNNNNKKKNLTVDATYNALFRRAHKLHFFQMKLNEKMCSKSTLSVSQLVGLDWR